MPLFSKETTFTGDRIINKLIEVYNETTRKVHFFRLLAMVDIDHNNLALKTSSCMASGGDPPLALVSNETTWAGGRINLLIKIYNHTTRELNFFRSLAMADFDLQPLDKSLFKKLRALKLFATLFKFSPEANIINNFFNQI